ncbi:hypothetical protein G210_3018, partial [Candida maltosa Xu316]
QFDDDAFLTVEVVIHPE